MERKYKTDTWKELNERLVEEGIASESLEVIRRMTAPHRRMRRRGEIRAILGGEYSHIQQWGLLLVDWIGVGKGLPCSEDPPFRSSSRLPLFQQCGKGRKNASDGPAWTAALVDIRKELEAEYGFQFRLLAGDPTGPTCKVGQLISEYVEEIKIPGNWALCTAKYAIQQKLDGMDGIFGGTLQSWSRWYADVLSVYHEYCGMNIDRTRSWYHGILNT